MPRNGVVLGEAGYLVEVKRAGEVRRLEEVMMVGGVMIVEELMKGEEIRMVEGTTLVHRLTPGTIEGAVPIGVGEETKNSLYCTWYVTHLYVTMNI